MMSTLEVQVLPKAGMMSRWPEVKGTAGGQGVHRDMESEGLEEKYRAVVDVRRTGRPRARRLQKQLTPMRSPAAEGISD